MCSVVEYMRLSRQIQASLFLFLWKDFEQTKTQIKPKPTNKNTNERTKNNKGNIFLRIKTSKRGWNCYFVLWCFLYAQNLFVKNRLTWNCLNSFIYSTTDVYPYQPAYGEHICARLFLFVIISKNLFFLWKPFLSVIF